MRACVPNQRFKPTTTPQGAWLFGWSLSWRVRGLTWVLGAMQGLLASCVIVYGSIAQATTYADVIMKSKSSIPPEVLSQLVALCSPCDFADIGEDWDRLPDNTYVPSQRRFTRISSTGSEWSLTYEHGPDALHQHTAIFAVKPSAHLIGGSCHPPNGSHCEW